MADVLVVDDEAGIRSFLKGALSPEGHEVDEASSAGEALEVVERRKYDLVITDLRMPNMSGMDLVRRLRTEHPSIEVIVLTAHSTISTAVEAIKLGAFDYLEKPLASPAQARKLVARALERTPPAAAEDLPRGGDSPALTYGAPAMGRVVHALRKVAVTNATVLLTGESGTGKEVAARAIHRWSPRAEGPYVAVNCAVLSANLLESELFGHERGAFTGAHARRAGRLELANGGTFFLDEIGELAPDLQAKLLRVLQERCFEPVGSNETIACDVRFIAATNRDLLPMVGAGTFREDLYHRLAVFPVRLPSLRERREDIVPLARHLLSGIAASNGRPGLELSLSACLALEPLDLPGNVRELRNLLERATILSEGDELQPEHFDAMPAPAHRVVEPVHGGTLAGVERETIRRALESAGGNRKKAAAQLRIGLRTLYEKLKRYGLE